METISHHLAIIQTSLKSNLREPALDSRSRDHMEHALAHTEEVIIAVSGRRCRTVQQLAQDKQAFDLRLEEALRQSAGHFLPTPTDGTEADNQHASKSLDGHGRRRQTVNLETAQAALNELLCSDIIKFDTRAHLKQAFEHTREAHIATNDPDRARSVAQLTSDLEKVTRLFAKLRNRPNPVACLHSIRT